MLSEYHTQHGPVASIRESPPVLGIGGRTVGSHKRMRTMHVPHTGVETSFNFKEFGSEHVDGVYHDHSNTNLFSPVTHNLFFPKPVGPVATTLNYIHDSEELGITNNYKVPVIFVASQYTKNNTSVSATMVIQGRVEVNAECILAAYDLVVGEKLRFAMGANNKIILQRSALLQNSRAHAIVTAPALPYGSVSLFLLDIPVV